MREDLPFTIEEWRDEGAKPVEVLARAENLPIAYAAYQAACRTRPLSCVTLRIKARVLAEQLPK